MSGTPELVRALSLAWDQAGEAGGGSPMGARLEEARGAWPGVRLPREVFLAHVAERVAERKPPEPLVYAAGLHLADLYLVCGCLHADPVALRGIEPLLASVPMMVRALSADPGFADDVRARVGERLLVSGPGKTPRLARYGGEGSLRSWFTVVVNREALAMRRSEGRMQPAGSGREVGGLLTGRVEPELDLLRARFAPQIEMAMREALEALPARDRLVLRLSMLDGVTMQQIAASYRVNQSTVSRWIARALESVHEAVRRSVRERWDLPPTEVESLLAAVRSRVEVSLGGLLVSSLRGQGGEP